MTVIAELLDRIPEGGEAANNALRALGLLLEQHHARRPEGDDGGLSELLGPDLAEYRLSEDEVTEAITGLSAYLQGAEVPNSGALWALGKSADERAVPVLIETLSRFLHDPAHEPLAHQALTSLLPFGTPEARAAVRRAAQEGQGEVKEDAEDFLTVLGLS